jgi:SNF2 family DNA or RNA helicase
MHDYHFPGPIDVHRASKHVVNALKSAPLKLSNKGAIIADVMGLGKTVEAVAGAILRNAIAEAQKKAKKPTLICTPNEAVLVQWADTLIKAGVDRSKIYRFQTKKCGFLQGDIYILCTIYDLQTECRYCFDSGKNYKSPLFPTTPSHLLHVLQVQYKAERGRIKKNRFRRAGESINECIRRALSKYESHCDLTFRTTILDEAHFVRNLKTFWGLAAAMIGLHSESIFPMSGTPYNNSPQDIATLMSFIDPKEVSAREKWWKKATKDSAAHMVLKQIKDWNDNFLIRRGKDVIARQLPPKTISEKQVSLSQAELSA